MQKRKIFAIAWTVGILAVLSATFVFAQTDSSVIPLTPSSLRFEPVPTATTIYLQWIDNSNNEDAFYVDRKFITDGSYAGHWATLASNTTSFADTNVVPGQHYDYRVQACNAAGCSDISRSDAVTLSAGIATTCTLTLDKSSYTTAENVNYTYTCSKAAASITVQVVKPDGTATTYVTGNNVTTASLGFSTSNLAPGAYTLRLCINDTACSQSSIVSYAFAVTAATSTTGPPTSCKLGEKCSKSSWCESGGFKCFYPDAQINCVQWPNGPVNKEICPAGTSSCDPADLNCTVIGQVVPYVQNRTCSNGRPSYSLDGKQFTCVGYGDSIPAGYSTCRPDDASCIPENAYGPSNGSCMNAMKCSQKTSDSDPKNDVFCAKMNTSTTSMPADVSCPAGYSQCSPTDANCKSKGESWTDSNASYYCMGGQKCTAASGGGSCISWNEICPAGTKYCGANDANCVEPDSYRSSNSTSSSGGNYFYCGGGAGTMPFYSATQAYCPPKRSAGSTMSSWTAADIKEVLAKLGSGWGLCNKNPPSGQSLQQCIEPGQSGPSNSWCAWTPPNNASSWSNSTNALRTCPALEGWTTTPIITPPPPIGTTTTSSQWTKRTWTFSDGSTETSYVLTRTDKEYVDYLDSVSAQCRLISKSKFSWKQNAGGDTVDNWKNFGIPDCSGSAPVVITPPRPDMMRECKEGEFSTGTNYCMMPMYRWNIADKKFEKCDAPSKTTTYAYVDVKSAVNPKYTNCMSMNLSFEKDWKTIRYTVRPPEKYGEEYMPPWDVASPSYQYNPATDQFDKCDLNRNSMSATAMATPQYMPPCTPVSDLDKEWLLGRYRAEYKMFQIYNAQYHNKAQPVPGIAAEKEQALKQGVKTAEPVSPLIAQTPAVPVIPANQCKKYLLGFAQSQASKKSFWKDVNRLYKNAPHFADSEAIKQELDDTKNALIDVDAMVRAGKCDTDTLTALQAKTNALDTDLLPSLSLRLSDLKSLTEAAQCRSKLESRLKQLKSLSAHVGEGESEKKQNIATLVSSIEDKFKEFESRATEFDYDVVAECADFSQTIQPDISAALRVNDKDINRIIDTVITKKFTPAFDTLTEQLDDKNKKLDDLVIRVAELHKALENFTQQANAISDKIATSYQALSRINDKFAVQKGEMQTAKERLLPLVGDATRSIKENSCVSSADRDSITQKLANIAIVNWVGDSAQQVESRLNFFLSSCKAKDLTRDDVTAFISIIDALGAQNAQASYKDGLTFDPAVPTHEWYYGAYQAAYASGIVTKALPDNETLAQDALLMILRAVGETDITGNCTLKTPNVKFISSYAACAANRASDKGLVLPNDMTAPVTRVKIAEWIDQLAKLPKHGEVADFSSYADASAVTRSAERTAISDMIANGIMVGDSPDGGATKYFRPQTPLTRAAVVVILEKLSGVLGTSAPK